MWSYVEAKNPIISSKESTGYDFPTIVSLWIMDLRETDNHILMSVLQKQPMLCQTHWGFSILTCVGLTLAGI